MFSEINSSFQILLVDFRHKVVNVRDNQSFFKDYIVVSMDFLLVFRDNIRDLIVVLKVYYIS